jgi:hypothetical protein
MHRLHHAKAPQYHNGNFSFDLVFWDRLFGTYAPPDAVFDEAAAPIGLDDNPFNSRGSPIGIVRDYFVTTYVVFWNELRKTEGLDPKPDVTRRRPMAKSRKAG